jgi:hypothetical protein
MHHCTRQKGSAAPRARSSCAPFKVLRGRVFIIVQGATGRVIASRYTVLHTVVHEDAVYAIVCPDAATASAQKPCALRVYELAFPTMTWRLCSPCEKDGAHATYPLPRKHAAFADSGSMVRQAHHLLAPTTFACRFRVCTCVHASGCAVAATDRGAAKLWCLCRCTCMGECRSPLATGA